MTALNGSSSVVVADPVLEEVPEDVERIRAARAAFEELDEPLVRCRPLLGEVQVGDEERRHHARYFFGAPTSVTDSMTTACLGTSLRNGPAAPVGDFAIFVTTSMPETTLPNTA